MYLILHDQNYKLLKTGCKGPVIKYRQWGDGGETKFLRNIFLTTPLIQQIFSGPPHKS